MARGRYPENPAHPVRGSVKKSDHTTPDSPSSFHDRTPLHTPASRPGPDITTVSGGIEIPWDRFEPWAEVPGSYVASIAGLGAEDLGAMVSGNEVADCQSDKVGI